MNKFNQSKPKPSKSKPHKQTYKTDTHGKEAHGKEAYVHDEQSYETYSTRKEIQSRGNETNYRSKTAHTAKRAQETDYIVKEPAELMKWLLATLSGKGRNKVKSILARGQVSVEGKVVTKYNFPLQAGNRVVINWSEVTADALLGLNILYEDEHLIVINKQAGLLSIATDEEKQQTAYRLLMEHVQQQDPRNRIFVVHRLDRETSGVMMFAKSEEIKQHLQNNWRDTVEERTYVVVVEGCVAKEKGKITSWLKESKTLQMLSSPTPHSGGLKAVTHYKVLQKNNDYSLLDVRLETGRKNQIRVHMQDIGHSIVGDRKYGARTNPINRMGLHARVLAFHHPVTGELLRFETDIPAKFNRLFHN